MAPSLGAGSSRRIGSWAKRRAATQNLAAGRDRRFLGRLQRAIVRQYVDELEEIVREPWGLAGSSRQAAYEEGLAMTGRWTDEDLLIAGGLHRPLLRYDSDDEDGLEACCCCPGRSTPEGAESSSGSGNHGGGSWRRSAGAELAQQLICSRPGRLALVAISMLLIYLCYLALATAPPSTTLAFGEQVAPLNSFNNSRPLAILEALCKAYDNHEVSGESCNRICYKRDWTVMDFHEGNKIVILMKEGGQTTVLKSAHPFFSAYEKPNPNIDEEAFTDKVLAKVNSQLHLGWPMIYKRHLIETLWPLLIRTDHKPMSQADRNSLWSLLSQEEFVTFRVLPLTRVTPKIMGTCGHFYEVESLVAFKMKGYYLNLKGKILVHLMGTLKLFHEFLNEPLQWCDVRFDNLGLSADYPKRFVIMDADALYTESRLRELMRARPCVVDSDCRMGDCEARCRADNHCGPERSNDNVDVFCKKLVNQMFGSSWSRNNKYLSACHDTTTNATQRLNELRLVWSWNLSDV